MVRPPDFAAQLTQDREPRGLRRPLNVADLFDKHGDAKVTDDAPAFANYERARAFSLYDRCKVRYGLCP
jgi:hypothetical protein